MKAQRILSGKGTAVRVVSVPCSEVFGAKDRECREWVLPADISVPAAVDAGVTSYWCRYVGMEGVVVGINHFGESAPGKLAFEYFGIAERKIAEVVEELIRKINS